jgi:hypothetical protein
MKLTGAAILVSRGVKVVQAAPAAYPYRYVAPRRRMTDDEFDAFVQTCGDELEEKQAALEKQFGLGQHARWAYDGNSGILTFANDQGVVVVEADTTQLGSYSVNAKTWRWAWANPSVPESERIKSAKLKALGERTGMDVFRNEGFNADEQMAWEVAAMGVHELGALGCYRGLAKHLFVFFAINRIAAAGCAT